MKNVKFLLVTAVCLFFLLAYTTMCQAVEQKIETSTAIALQPFVYLTLPASQNELVNQTQMESLNIQLVNDTNQFAQVLQDPQVKAIYIHPEAFLLLQPEHLEKAFNRGVVLVALNTPLSYLVKSVHTNQSIPDLNFAYANGRLAVAIVAKVVKPGAGGETLHTNFFEKFEDLAMYVETYLVDFNPLENQSKPQDVTPLGTGSWIDPSCHFERSEESL